MMLYVITTKPPEPTPGSFHDAMSEAAGLLDVTRRAVATLEEARRAARAAIPEAASQEEWNAQYAPKEAAWNLPEAGGTVGPLPDGAVVEVEALSPLMLSARIPGDPGAVAVLVRGCLDKDDWADLIDAYNAAQVAA